jgi:hypothetical protein
MAKTPQPLPVLQGLLPTQLANAISDAMQVGLARGMATDEACCVAIAVVCDYARGEYGNDYLDGLVGVVLAQKGRPLPFDAGNAHQ